MTLTIRPNYLLSSAGEITQVESARWGQRLTGSVQKWRACTVNTGRERNPLSNQCTLGTVWKCGHSLKWSALSLFIAKLRQGSHWTLKPWFQDFSSIFQDKSYPNSTTLNSISETTYLCTQNNLAVQVSI